MNGINLIPSERLALRARARCLRRWAWILGGTCATGMIPLVWEIRDRTQLDLLEKDRQTLQHQYQQQQELHRNLLERRDALNQEIESAERHRRKRPWADLLETINEERPPDVWLYSIATGGVPQSAPASPRLKTSESKKSASPKSAPPPAPSEPQKLILKGSARQMGSYLKYVENLDNRKSFKEVNFESDGEEEMGELGKIYRFEIVCEW